MNKARDYTLRRRLLIRLWAPLFFVLMLGAVAAFALAQRMGSVVYDRWLYDSVMTLAQQIKVQDGKAVLNLPKRAVEMFEWDSVDRIFEEATGLKGGAIFSNAKFPALRQRLTAGQPLFYDAYIDGLPVRVAAVLMKIPGDSVVIRVAETKHKRHSLVADILLLAVPLQALIFALAGGLVWLAVTTSLRVVDDIAARLAGYNPDGLVPVSTLDHAPAEVRPLLVSINRLIAKLADAQMTQTRFIANAAHQLRTPLATLQVQTERALREPDPARHGEALSHVLAAVTRSRHLAHQLLTLARSERSSEQTLTMIDADLAIMVRSELERWADVAIDHHIDLGYEGPESGVLLRAEPHLLREMIGNLVDNAIRYGRPGGLVTLGLRTGPVVLTVDDDGPGIPPGERARVVERFYRLPGAGGDGCGLGLAIAREISARHGAALEISDNPLGRGTRVQIVFPK